MFFESFLGTLAALAIVATAGHVIQHFAARRARERIKRDLAAVDEMFRRHVGPLAQEMPKPYDYKYPGSHAN
jgi:hypothetical protein